MTTAIGKNLESACKSWHHREANRLHAASESAAAVVSGFPAGTPGWKSALAGFVAAENALTAHLDRMPS